MLRYKNEKEKKDKRMIADFRSAGDAGDSGSALGSGGSPGEGDGDPLRYSHLENPHAQRSLVGSPRGSKESDMTEAAERERARTHARSLTDIGWEGLLHPPLKPACRGELPPQLTLGGPGLSSRLQCPPALGAVPGTRQALGSHGPSADTRRHSRPARRLLPLPGSQHAPEASHPAGPSVPKSSAAEPRGSCSLTAPSPPISWTDISLFHELLSIVLLFIPNFLKRLRLAFLQRQQLELSRLLLVNTFKHSVKTQGSRFDGSSKCK